MVGIVQLQWTKVKKACIESRFVEQSIIESGFIDAFNKIKKTGILDDFVYNLMTMLNDKSLEGQADELVKEINVLENKKRQLLEIRLERIITKEDFEIQCKSISEKRETKNEQLSKVNSEITNKDVIAIRIEDLRKIISIKTIERFDSDTFELLIDKIIVGGYDEKGKPDPYLLEYKFKLNYNYKINGQVITKIHSVSKWVEWFRCYGYFLSVTYNSGVSKHWVT